MTQDWLEEIETLMRLFSDQGEVDFFELQKGAVQVRISRNGGTSAFGGRVLPAPVATPSSVDASVHPAPVASSATDASTKVRVPALLTEQEGVQVVLAPMVGTFYRASAPGSPPFVEIGAPISSGATMALIEAMKVFVTVTSDVDGVIEDIFVANEQFVEFAQPLFRVRMN